MLNKKIVLVAIALCLSMSTAFAAPKNRPYIGVDYQINKFEIESSRLRNSAIKKSLNGVSLFVGYRWNEIGLEGGGTYMQQVNYAGSTGSLGNLTILSLTQKNNNAYIDGIYYFPIAKKLDAKAILGLGYLTTDLSANVINNNITRNTSKTYQKVGVRAGLGLEYYFTDTISSSLSYKYQNGNKFYKNMNTFALGAAYHF